MRRQQEAHSPTLTVPHRVFVVQSWTGYGISVTKVGGSLCDAAGAISHLKGA